jgi:hypothetical protein
MHHFCRDKYKLELRWEGLEYHSDSVLCLKGATFSGPVLREAAKLQSPDRIDLDLTPQLLTVMDSYYIIRLEWQGCEYLNDGTIKLRDVTLTNKFLKTLHKFQDGDYLIINTEKHEEATHAFHLVYESYAVRKDSKPYDYRKK